MVSKVLKLDQRVLPIFVHHSLHKLINQIVIGLGAIPVLVQAHVKGILEQRLCGALKGNALAIVFHRTPTINEEHSNSSSPHYQSQHLSPREDIFQVVCQRRLCTGKVFQRGFPFRKLPSLLSLKSAHHQSLLQPKDREKR